MSITTEPPKDDVFTLAESELRELREGREQRIADLETFLRVGRSLCSGSNLMLIRQPEKPAMQEANEEALKPPISEVKAWAIEQIQINGPVTVEMVHKQFPMLTKLSCSVMFSRNPNTFKKTIRNRWTLADASQQKKTAQMN